MGGFMLLFLNISCGQRIKQYAPNYDHFQNNGQVNQGMLLAIQKTIDQFINDDKIPGLQLSVILADSSALQMQSGTLTFDRKYRIKNTDILRIGSITKIFTAFLVLKAAEDGKLLLSNPLSKWYPEIANSENITISELLNHTSGIREILESFSVKMKSLSPHKNWDPAELIKVISKQKPYFDPRTDFHYSNSNYIILGCILEKIYNRSIRELLADMVFSPLNLNSTHFLPITDIPKNLISGFDRDLLPWPGLYENKSDNTAWASLAYASGAMASNARELNIFINSLFNDDILTANSLKSMINFVPIEKANHKYLTGYGLGVTQFNINGIEYWGHEGMFIGFESILLYAPEKQYSIALIGNVSSYSRFEIIKRIQELIIVKS